MAGDPHYAQLPGYEPVRLRRYFWLVLYVRPWARLWSDRIFLAAGGFLVVFLLFQPFIRYYRKRER